MKFVIRSKTTLKTAISTLYLKRRMWASTRSVMSLPWSDCPPRVGLISSNRKDFYFERQSGCGDVSWLSGLIVEINQPMLDYRRFVSIGVFSLWSLQTTTLTRQDKRNSVRVRHCFFKILFVPLNCEKILRGYLETVSPSHSLATNRFTFQLQNYTCWSQFFKNKSEGSASRLFLYFMCLWFVWL